MQKPDIETSFKRLAETTTQLLKKLTNHKQILAKELYIPRKIDKGTT